MKKLFNLLITLFIFSTVLVAKGGSYNNIMDKGEIVIGLDDTFAPMGFRDEKGNIVGFDIDLANEVAKRMGIKTNFKACEWDGIIFDLKSKKIDLIWNGLTITPAREKQILFSDPYFSDDQIIIVRDPNIKTLDDLKGKKVGVQLGSTSNIVFENSILPKSKTELKKYPTNVEALLDLEAGRTNAVIIDGMVGKYYIAKKNGFIVLDDTLAKENVGVGIRKEDLDLKMEIDKKLSEIKQDGTFDNIYKKWFGNN